MAFAATSSPFCSSPSSPLDNSFPENSYLSVLLPRGVPLHIHALPYPSKRTPYHTYHTRHPTLTRKASAPLASMIFESKEQRTVLTRKCSKPTRGRTLPPNFGSQEPERLDAEAKPKKHRPTRSTQLPADCNRDKPLPQEPTTTTTTTSTTLSAKTISNPKRLIKRRKSLTELEAKPHSSEDDAGTPASFPSSFVSIPPSYEEKALDTPFTDDEVDLNDQKDKYHLKNHFRWVDAQRLHPYDPDDAPYMQSYNRIQLDNDRATEQLLNRLTPNGSPTFYDYGSNPPSDVLDLGCCQGGWVIQAATTWKSTRVTGFDLVDIMPTLGSDLDPTVAKNISWVRGNFVKYDLPFSDNSFDLVRMANLSLAIPYLSWPRVLSEVRRVLTQGGRLELIDDHIFFPYGNSPSPPPTPTITPTRSTIDSFCSIDYDDSIPDDGSTVVDDDVTIRQKLLPPTPSVDRVAEWEERAENARGLETMFQRMLEKEFRISSRASAFTLTSLQSIFGRSNSKKFKSYHLALAAAEDEHDKNADSTADGKKPWIIDWDRKDKKRGASGDDTHVTPSKYPDTIAAKAVACLGISTSPSKYPDGISPKAAGRLGIPARPCRPYAQSPGLVLYPSTFIPMDPMHLEMHACKHMHVLLGCKLSLARVMADVKDDKGEPMVKRDELDDLLWEYECFRRQRFNWPSQNSGRLSFPLVESGTASHSKSPSFRIAGGSDTTIFGRPRNNSSNSLATAQPFEDLTHVRTFRVYHAVKMDNDSTTSLTTS